MKQNERHQQQEKEIQSLLEKMPKIKDTQDPDLLFEKIQTRMMEDQEEQGTKKFAFHKWLNRPVVASAAVILLIVILSATYLNNQNPMMDQANMAKDQSLMEEPEADMEKQESLMERAPVKEPDNQDSAEFNGLESDDNKMFTIQDTLKSKAVFSVPENHIQFSYVVPDQNKQYLVPISFIVPKDEEKLNDYFSNMNRYVRADEWGVDPSLFSGISFDFALNDQTVTVDMPKEFNDTGGSARESLLINSLYQMMAPLNIKTIYFTTEGEQGADFAHFGTLTELEVPSQQKNAYKLYQVSANHPVWIVPIPADPNSSIEEAIESMYAGEEDFGIRPSIPEQISIEEIQSDSEVLSITFSQNVNLMPTQPMVYMFDAILMTARSYGFDDVRFLNSNVSKIGPYNLDETVSVPVAVNLMPAAFK